VKYVGALDQGTTSTRFIVFDQEGSLVSSHQLEHQQIYPQPGWVEHDPWEIWDNSSECISKALKAANLKGSDIAGIGITNQRETTLLWERATGQPLHNALVWKDRRTADRCQRLREQGLEERVRARTGLVLDPYFSGTKLAWLLDELPGARARAQRGELACGTVDTFLINRLTRGRVHVTDPSNASRTLLCSLDPGDWDDELLALFEIPSSLLPEVRSSSEVYGTTFGVPGLPDGIPIAGIAGDQQAALFGQACFTPGSAKCTYGTGAFVLQNTGPTPRASRHRLLTTIAWRLGQETTYALEGSCFIAGAAVQWLRDGLGLIRTAAEIEALARAVPDTGGVHFVPALVGLGAPHWRAEALGLISGLTRGTTAAHLARATLEGIALSVAELLLAMNEDAETTLGELRVDSGAAANDLLLELQADLLQTPILRPRLLETTALGAAFLAGLAVGFWSDQQEVAAVWAEQRRFTPTIDAAAAAARLAAWREAVRKA